MKRHSNVEESQNRKPVKRKVRKRGLALRIALAAAALYLGLFWMELLPDWLCWEKTASLQHGWNLILVNEEYKLPKSWETELIELPGGEMVDSRIYPALQQMFDEAESQGVYLVVASGYRTEEYQRQLMEEKVEQLEAQGYSGKGAKEEAGRWVAEAGHSEHQTGLAVDINADKIHTTGAAAYTWLADNAWEYGFILRYPEDKEAVTGTAYEPWHYRYVGQEAAGEMERQGLCLEEYLERSD